MTNLYHGLKENQSDEKVEASAFGANQPHGEKHHDGAPGYEMC